MQLPVEYNTPIKDEQGKYYLCKPVFVSVRGGRNVAYVTEDGVEIKREPVHRYKNRVYRRRDGVKERYKPCEPIFEEDLCQRERDRLRDMIDTGEARALAGVEGVYYIPKVTSIGGVEREVPVYAPKIVERRFISDGASVYGYFSGHTLRNLAGLTRQVAPFTEVTTNVEYLERRDFKVGVQRVITHRPPTEITAENAKCLQFLDLMTLIEPEHLDELSLGIFRQWLKDNTVTYEMLFPYFELFPSIVKNNVENKVIKDEIAP